MSLASRIGEYLRSRRNRVASALAALAVMLLLADPVWPAGILLVVGFYALGAAAVRSNRMVDRFGFEPRKLERSLQWQIAAASGRVSPQIIARLQRIESILRTQILPGLEGLPPGSLDLYLVERTVDDYVPTAVGNYLRLSREHGLPDPLAHDIVTDELAVIERQLCRIAAQVRRADIDRLLAHQRFLRDRFGEAPRSA